MILAIDPGNTDSAYVLMNGYVPVSFGKISNAEMRKKIIEVHKIDPYVITVIERVASYGMAVGKEVFETCEWVGRFTEQTIGYSGQKVEYLYRKDIKMNLCGQTRAKDSNIRQALIDRFAEHDFKFGRGVKANPDFFYGFAADVWSAYAVGATYLDIKGGHKNA